MRYFIFLLVSVTILTGAGCATQPEKQAQPTQETEPTEQQVQKDEDGTTNGAEPDTTEKTETGNEQPTEEDGSDDASMDMSLYEGTWFDISYPSNFTASPQPAEDSLNNRAQTDEAVFTSPDESVEFFVYSPLWSGEPKSYLEIKPSEELVDEETQVLTEAENPDQFGDKITRWVTIKAKDGSYTRSYVSKKAQVDTGSEVHHVFGIKYEDQDAYDRYKDAYQAFKESLIQYAD
jgi:hypothetical protein